MADHFAATIEIKDAVIGGDLVGVRSPARALLERVASVPHTWAPFIAANTRYAEEALAAKDLTAAAQAAAGLADTCGDCHVALGRGPRLAVAVAPRRARAHDAEKHMARHQWAVDRMWEALVAHDDARWEAGAAALAHEFPLRSRDFLIYADEVDGRARLDNHVSDLGKRATSTVVWPSRARLYGEVLATCAGCHVRRGGDQASAKVSRE